MTIASHIATAHTPTSRNCNWPSALTCLPGVLLATAIAGVAFLVRNIHGMAVFSPMILAIVIGMAFHNIVGTPSLARPGIAFSLRRLLRAAIVLLGFQLTASQIASVGPRGLLIVALSLAATFGFTVWIGRALGVGRKLTELIAAGTSICGASAIIATNTVTEAHDEDVAYAIACVTVSARSRCLPIPSCPACCTSIPAPTASGAEPRSTRSLKSSQHPFRTVNAPARLARWSNCLASCCSRLWFSPSA
jgi:uncharacterized membrane protein YadS